MAGTTKPRVLIADDDKVARTYLRLVLSSSFEVEEASDALEAMHLLTSGHFDCLILDDQMPKGTGVSIARQVRGTPRMSHVPIVLVTATATAARQIEGMRCGVSVFMHKPVDGKQLLTLVETLTRHGTQIPA